MQRELQRVVPYHLATERTVVALNATVTMTIIVPGDADFEGRYITGSFTSVTGTLRIRDGGTRLEITSRPIFAALITGTGAQPYVLPTPVLFVRGSTIEVEFADLSGAQNTVQVVFCGFLVYPAPVGQM
jgi:hypothetical protein